MGLSLFVDRRAAPFATLACSDITRADAERKPDLRRFAA
jgi:hypothetical protein